MDIVTHFTKIIKTSMLKMYFLIMFNCNFIFQFTNLKNPIIFSVKHLILKCNFSDFDTFILKDKVCLLQFFSPCWQCG